jgi:ABC-type nitrate/sulfonate/bicarbonate transport system permease component
MTGWLWRFSGIAILLLGWEAAARSGLVNEWLVVPPSRLPAVLGSLWQSGELPRHLQATLSRMAIAFGVGSACGLLIGLGAGASRRFARPVESIVGGLHSLPKMALLPLAMALFGIGETSRALPAFLACFTLMAIHGMDAARGVPPALVEQARVYGARGWELAQAVYVPSCLPQLFTGFRLASGTSLVLIIAAEMLGAEDGIGSLIWLAGQAFQMEKLYTGLVMCGLLGAALMAGMAWMEKRLIPWRQTR